MRQKSSVATVEREAQALSLRRRGMPYNDIATYMGLSGPGAAYRIVQRGLCRLIQEPADDVRAMELDRLDTFLFRLSGRIELGDTKAIDTALKVMDRRAKLMGLDAPTKVQAEVTTNDGTSIDSEVARLVALLDSSPARSVDAPNSAV